MPHVRSIAWGEVVDASVSPPQVRWAGSTDDQPVPLGAKGWTPVDGDTVILFDFGGHIVALPVEAL